jgi:hypothetical protein
MRLLTVFAVVLVLGLPLALGSAARSQEVPPPDLAARVAELERGSMELRRRVLELEERVQSMDRKVATHEGWLRSVPRALDALVRGTDQAVEQGFTRAGANMGAREALLQGLRDFAAALRLPAKGPEASGR